LIKQYAGTETSGKKTDGTGYGFLGKGSLLVLRSGDKTGIGVCFPNFGWNSDEALSIKQCRPS
jgi:hypothetical protein